MASLFDNPPITTRPAKAPGWVVDELVRKWGVPLTRAKSYPCRQAFAVLHRYREGEKASSTEVIQSRMLDIAQRLEVLANDTDANSEEIVAVMIEGLSVIDHKPLVKVGQCLIEYLRLPPKSAA